MRLFDRRKWLQQLLPPIKHQKSILITCQPFPSPIFYRLHSGRAVHGLPTLPRRERGGAARLHHGGAGSAAQGAHLGGQKTPPVLRFPRCPALHNKHQGTQEDTGQQVTGTDFALPGPLFHRLSAALLGMGSCGADDARWGGPPWVSAALHLQSPSQLPHVEQLLQLRSEQCFPEVFLLQLFGDLAGHQWARGGLNNQHHGGAQCRDRHHQQVETTAAGPEPWSCPVQWTPARYQAKCQRQIQQHAEGGGALEDHVERLGSGVCAAVLAAQDLWRRRQWQYPSCFVCGHQEASDWHR